MPISKAARQAGVSRQSVQYYLMIGLLKPSHTTPSGQRLFDVGAIDRIRLIRHLNETGYPLRAIRELFLQNDRIEKGNTL
jgi:DNA-binding transcriptional MerR regulator